MKITNIRQVKSAGLVFLALAAMPLIAYGIYTDKNNPPSETTSVKKPAGNVPTTSVKFTASNVPTASVKSPANSAPSSSVKSPTSGAPTSSVKLPASEPPAAQEPFAGDRAEVKQAREVLRAQIKAKQAEMPVINAEAKECRRAAGTDSAAIRACMQAASEKRQALLGEIRDLTTQLIDLRFAPQTASGDRARAGSKGGL